MELRLVKLTPDCGDRACFEQVNNEAFPLSERLSMDEIFRLASFADTDVLGIYDGELPVGFAVLVKNDACGYVYFLAIGKPFRSRGYGSGAVKKILGAYSGLQVILDFEEVVAGAENYGQRVRRKAFYLQNGFHETGRYTRIGAERFEVVCSSLPLRERSFSRLIHILHRHNPKFMDALV